MNNPAVFIGKPLTFKNKFQVYPPTVADAVGNQSFSQYLKILTITHDDIFDEFAKQKEKEGKLPTPFEFLLINCYHSPQFKQIAIDAFEFFIHQPVHFFYEQKMIIIGDLEEMAQKINTIDELICIKEEEYFDFQNIIREVCGDKTLEKDGLPDPNEDPRIAAIKAKARARDRIKAKQQAKNGMSIQTCLTAICCMGIGITPLNIGEMSYAAIGPIMKMMQEKEKYDIDIRSLLAGADSKKIKPKYWIRNPDKD